MKRNIAVHALDMTLEIAVLPSFSALGPRIRAAIGNWQAPPPKALAGKTALVTGPTSGIGAATARAFAELGARLLLVGRHEDRLEQLAGQLGAPEGGGRHRVAVADISSLSSVRTAVEQLLATEARLDLLVDNAGAMFEERGETAQGAERTLAVLVLGPFALQAGLLPLLRAAPAARVINVTSGGMYAQAVHLDDLEWRSRVYDGTRAYAQAKRIQVALMREWARRFGLSGVTFNAMHPGWADTPGLAESLPGFYRLMRPVLRTPEQGADTIVWLATSPDVKPPGGRLYLDRRPRPFDRLPQTRLTLDDRVRLWNTISELTGTTPERG
jgi:dehydrogenase/reductase SDR family protein 12